MGTLLKFRHPYALTFTVSATGVFRQVSHTLGNFAVASNLPLGGRKEIKT